MSASPAPALRVGQLYPREMSIYGDRGNILALRERAAQRGIAVEVVPIERGPVVFGDIDLFFIGGGQDQDQDLVARDLVEEKRGAIAEAVAGGAVLLAVCGGYQLLGTHYTAVSGKRIPGLGLLDLRTSAGRTRYIGNVVIDAGALGLTPNTIVGFENHAGRTHLGAGVRPLGRCIVGNGNNGQDHMEGALSGTVFGTYVHGSLLPKNPHLTDHLLELAIRRRTPGYELAPAPAEEELAAHFAVRARVLREGALPR
jgi:CobQ-like glutamine amidotransferase family enzyme